jgi:hypothetical protein
MIHLLIILFVVVVTAVLFVAWVVVSLCRLIWRAIAGTRQINVATNGSGRPCMLTGCRANNPMHAKFCRRCGSSLRAPVFAQPTPQPVPRYDPYNGRHMAV